MQMQLPFFPDHTKLINATCGVKNQDGLVYYLHNGQPIFCHDENDMNSYRFIMGNLINTRLCAPSEVARALGVSSRNIQRYAKKLREQGQDSFFNTVDKRGQCYQFTEDKRIKAQALLDEQLSQLEVARQVGLSESAIRYHINKGTLVKKNPLPMLHNAHQRAVPQPNATKQTGPQARSLA